MLSSLKTKGNQHQYMDKKVDKGLRVNRVEDKKLLILIDIPVSMQLFKLSLTLDSKGMIISSSYISV